MGNTLGGNKRTTKVMKINGETMKFKKPMRAGEIIKDYPGHVLLDSGAVKHFGISAKPLEPQQELKPKRLYFLVELPKLPEEKKVTRRARSGIQMSAKDRLESLMLARRSVSDLSIMKSSNIVIERGKESSEDRVTRLRMRLPKAEVEKLMMRSKNEAEAAEKIVDLYIANKACSKSDGGPLLKQQSWNADDDDDDEHHGVVKSGLRSREKRVGFLPISEGEIQLAVAS